MAESKKPAKVTKKAAGRSRPAAERPRMAAEAKPESPSGDARNAEISDWRGEVLSRIRHLIEQADPDVIEEVKWRKPSTSMEGVPVWSHDGQICTGETYQDKVKLTFAKGASLEDPAGLFNASLAGNTRRAIDIREGDEIDEEAFKSLVRAAAALNASKAKPKGKGSTGERSTAAKDKSPSAKPKLLSGGNPQIAKGDGDTPVQAYIAAMPDWKSDIGRRLDSIIVNTVPGVRKAVRWNSPFYGIEGQGWFLTFHCFTKYIKVAFFRGASLQPVPPVVSKHDEVRYLHIHEDDHLDEAQFATWVKQASDLPGDPLF